MESNETTISRYGNDTSSVDLSTSQNYMGRYVTNGTITYNKSPEARTYVLPVDYHDFIWDLSKADSFDIEGYYISFTSFDDRAIAFTIRKQE